MLTVNVVLLPGATLPEYKSEKAAGADLYANADMIVKPGETVLVPTGVRLEMPENELPGWVHQVEIRDRSGLAAKTKLRVGNSPGTIDEDYLGELKVIIDNITPPLLIPSIRHFDDHFTPQVEYATSGDVKLLDGSYMAYKDPEHGEYPLGTYLIRKGDRIAQAVLLPAIQMDLKQVEAFDKETTRGVGGFGHTGTR